MLKGFINFLSRLFGGPSNITSGTFAQVMAPYMTAMDFGYEDARESMAFDDEAYAVDRLWREDRV